MVTQNNRGVSGRQPAGFRAPWSVPQGRRTTDSDRDKTCPEHALDRQSAAHARCRPRAPDRWEAWAVDLRKPGVEPGPGFEHQTVNFHRDESAARIRKAIPDAGLPPPEGPRHVR